MSSLDETEGCEDLMIQVKNAWKCYSDSQYILRDLNISVPRGKIYSLLGSSGVGKTTLLNCIIGNMRLDSGHIKVDVKSRLQIGYMPQGLALYLELTLQETFHFFGIVLDMSRKEISTRAGELSELLQLPPLNTQITALSGGQQRRISVAVAMLKNPDLIILDEPTANLDSLLKQSIWNYLQRISKEDNKTILLTTHYIEEAKHSDKVGFMANGRILLEGSPEEVLNWTDPPSQRLEDIYYQLCSRELEAPEVSHQPQLPLSPSFGAEIFDKPSKFTMRIVKALFLKSLFYIRRNFLIFYTFIFSPAFMMFILALALQKPQNLKLGYVNYENECSNTVLNCSTPLSCRYMDNLREDKFQLVQFDSMNEGKEAMMRNEVWGVVKFNWNFSDGVVNRLDYFYASEHVEIAEDDEAKVLLDMSNYPISHLIKKHFYDMFLKSIEDWYTDCGWNTRAAHPIIRLEKPVHGSIDESLLKTGIATCTLMMMFSTGIALGLIFVMTDRELGTFDRCRISGMKTSELVVAGFLLCFACHIPSGIALLLIMYVYCGPYYSLGWSTTILYVQAVTGILIGSIIALTTTDSAKALQVTTGILGVFLYLSGIMWPPQGSHWLIQLLNYVIPPLPQVEMLRVISIRGFDVYSVIWALGHNAVWIIILAVIIILLSKRNEK